MASLPARPTAAAGITPATGGRRDATLALHSPAVTSRYQLLGLIARGGMAEVHLARVEGEAGFQKWVALKRILESYGHNAQIEKMFIDEARLVAKLSHPNLVQVFDFGRDEQGLFIAMEYVPGPNLAQVLRVLRKAGERPPEAPMLDAVIQILRGLDHAHRLRGDDGAPLGLVHRDVSPANVLLTSDGVAKLADFGVARAAERLGEATRAGKTRGKVAYMAPEQARSKPIDARTDVFAAGLLLWEALSGQSCYQAEGDAALLRKAAHAEVRTLGSVGVEVPAPLNAALATALEADPGKRFASAAAMADALESYHREAFPKYTAAALGAVVQRALGAMPPLAHLAVEVEAPAPAEPDPVARVRRPRAAVPETRPATDAATEPRMSSELTADPAGSRAEVGKSGRGRAVALSVVAIALGIAGGLVYVDRSSGAVQPPPTSLPPPAPLAPPPTPVVDHAAVDAKKSRAVEVRTAAPQAGDGTGYLSVKCEPWCDIRIDGHFSGRRSPASRIPLPAGRHTLQLVNPTVNLSRRAVVEIRAGEELSRYFNLVLDH